MEQRVLRWFGHMERLDDYRIARMVLLAEVRGRVQGRLRSGFMDGVQVALGSRGMTGVWRLRDNARKIGRSGEPWCIF